MYFCDEKFYDDLVAIDIYRSSDVSLPVPYNVAGIDTLSLSADSFHNPPILTAMLDGFDLDRSASTTGLTDNNPTLKVSKSLSLDGITYTHAIQAQVTRNIDAIRAIAASVRGEHLFVVATTYYGDRYALLAVPNTTYLGTEEQFGTDHQLTLAMSIVSLNPPVKMSAT